MEKPEFDPAQPFEAVASAKPAFDPQAPFTPVSAGASPAPSAVGSVPSKMEASLRGLGQGFTMGVQPIVSGALEAEQGAVDSLVNGSNAFGDQGRLAGLAHGIQNYRRARDTQKAQHEAASNAHPYIYGLSNFVGTLPLALATGGESVLGMGAGEGAALPVTQRAMNAAQLAGAAGAVQGFGSSPGDLTRGQFGQVAKDTANSAILGGSLGGLGAGLGAEAQAALEKLRNATPSIKQAFARLRGISPETLEAYLNPQSRAKVDAIATDFDSLHEGQLQNATRVAQDLQKARSDFIQDRTARINAILEQEQAAERPISIRPLLNKIEAERNQFLPVGSTSKNAISGLDEIQQDLLNLADRNRQQTFAPGPVDANQLNLAGPLDSDASVLLRRGQYEVPKAPNGFVKNATTSGDSELHYLPEGDELVSKTPGGPQNMHYAFTNQAGDVKSVDPIMGPLYNNSANSLRIQKPDGTRLQSALEVPDSLVEVEKSAVDPFVTPKQLNQLRRTFNDEAKAAYRNAAGQKVPGAEAVANLGDLTRTELDQISPQIREHNAAISSLYDVENGLQRGGLKQDEIEPSKLRDLLTAGPKRASNETPYIGQLDSLTGTNLSEERRIARAAEELNPEGLWNKIKTGYSQYPLTAGGLASVGALAAHQPMVAAGSAALGGTVAMLQAPALTKPLIRLAGSVGPKVMTGMEKVTSALQNNPAVLGKFSGVLMNAFQQGDLPVKNFVLQQSHPEYREILKNLDEHPSSPSDNE